MNVYFARSIRGKRKKEDGLIYQAIMDAIKTAGHTLQFDLPTPPSSTIYKDKYIYQRDLAWIDQCQALIAEVSGPSLGVGYEIAYAKHVWHLPILCVMEKDTGPVSAMISGGHNVMEYRDRSHLAAIIQTFLESYSGAEVIR